MKKSSSFLGGSIMLSVSLFLFSCKKQIAEPVADETTIALQTLAETNCKPAVFGVFEEFNPGTNWSTISQKWYENGKVKYFKGNFSGAAPGMAGHIGVEPQFNIQWGEVTYMGKQVFLHDVGKNRMVLRVQLDDLGRPEASYFYNETDNVDNAYLYDTTYYYYTGNRLDSIYRTGEVVLYQPSTSTSVYGKYVFQYDMYGNILSATAGPRRLNFIYDYSKPVSGMVANYILTTSFRLMEFLELIKVPMHHVLIETNYTDLSGGIIFQDKYNNHVISDGLVHSYQSQPGPNHKQTFYTGWECNGPSSQNPVNRQRNGITSLEQFQQLYPQSAKR